MKPAIFPVYEFRPLPDIRPLFRYNGGKWTPDDGEYDLAFVANNFCLYVEVPYQKNILWNWCKGGDWGARVQEHPNGNAWHYMLRDGAKNWGGDWGRDKHENEIASRSCMTYACDLYGASNGRGVSFELFDPTIAAGLVRERDTKKIVTFPESFQCMYCEAKP